MQLKKLKKPLKIKKMPKDKTYCNNCGHEECRMDRRRFKSRHLIPMFIGTHSTNGAFSKKI